MEHMQAWRCMVCKYIHQGPAPPEKCPVCKAVSATFEAFDPESSSREAAFAGDSLTGTSQTITSAARPWGNRALEVITGLMIRHHVHPISVHIPNGVLPVSLTMFVVAVLFDATTLARAGFYNLVFVMLALPLVIFTGFLDWERKYKKAWTSRFQIKIFAASVTFATCLISLCWYLIEPGVTGSSLGWLYILVNLLMVVSAVIAGHIGGKLVFKN